MRRWGGEEMGRRGEEMGRRGEDEYVEWRRREDKKN